MKRKKLFVLVTALCAMTSSCICFAAEEASYLQRLELSVSIFDGPGYDNNYVRNIERATLYTIVEEEMDEEGNLWGRLKSGAGWVDLDSARMIEDDPGPISIYFAEEALLENTEYLEYSEDDSWYPVKIAFQANERLADISFLSLAFREDYPDEGETLCMIDVLEEEEIFVAEVSFPGDMTAYGITFTDEDETEYMYTVSISGRNGSLVITEEAVAQY